MKNGKLFGKLSWIDLTAVIILLMVVIVFGVRLARTERQTTDGAVVKNDVSYTATLKFSSVMLPNNEPFVVGQNLTCENGEILGKVIAVKKEPSLLKANKENGERVEYTQENLVDYLVTYQGISVTENDVLVVNNGTPLVAGQSLTVNNRLFSGKAFVLSVKKSN